MTLTVVYAVLLEVLCSLDPSQLEDEDIMGSSRYSFSISLSIDQVSVAKEGYKRKIIKLPQVAVMFMSIRSYALLTSGENQTKSGHTSAEQTMTVHALF